LGAFGLFRMAASGAGLAVRLGIAGLRLKAYRRQAVKAFRAELKDAGLPLRVVEELSILYPDLDLSALSRAIHT